jgi:hypothetical protein
MDRVYFQRVGSGYRAVRGEVVRRVQLKLKASGSDPGEVDGIYGKDTETALKDFQRRQGFQMSGKITGETWSKLLEEKPPQILDRCLQLTGDFEGHGFQTIAGNFDDAGLTWGIIGFTLKHGEIQKILAEVQQTHPALLDQAFGNLKDELIRVLQQKRSEQLYWANSISIGTKKYRVEQTWEDAFEKLGTFPEVQAVQLQRVNNYWDIAVRDSERFRLETEMGIALCFDIAVQNGGIDFCKEERRIGRWLDSNPGATDRDRRVLIADVVAENSRPKYVEDVRQRKRAIATGEGDVHRAKYATRYWGIAEFPWKKAAPSPPSNLRIIQ